MSFKNKFGVNNKLPPKKFSIEQEMVNIYTNLRQILVTHELFNAIKLKNNLVDKYNIKKISTKKILEKVNEIINIIIQKILELNKEKYQLENYIIKLENDIKRYITEILENKIKNEIYIYSINKYSKIKEEYVQLKEKVKFKKGKFLNDDKKENEIFILRQENSNLKYEISKLEQRLKDYETNNIINNNFIINSYNKKNNFPDIKKKSKEKGHKNILNSSYSNKRMLYKINKEIDMNKTMNLFHKEKTKNRVIKNV